jgi:hypothetical protein
MASSPPLNSGANGYVGIHHIGFWVDDLVANGRRANSRPVEIEDAHADLEALVLLADAILDQNPDAVEIDRRSRMPRAPILRSALPPENSSAWYHPESQD